LSLDDGLEDLENALARRSERYELDVAGSVAFFAGWPEGRSTEA